jgi:hypothetical protein
MQCTLDSKAHSNFTATPIRHVFLDSFKIAPLTLTEELPRHDPAAFRRPGGKIYRRDSAAALPAMERP